MKRLPVLVWVLCLLLATYSDAEDRKIKRQVLKNCDAAERRMAALEQSERRDFADYLARALALDLPDQFHDIQIWQGFDPLAEYEVKTCAARLSMSLVPESIITLPKLLALLDDPLAPEELKELALEASLQIAFATRFHLVTGVEEAAVAEIFGLLGERAVMARAEVVEMLASEAQRVLLWQLAICQAQVCAPLLDEFTRIAPTLSLTDVQWRNLFHAKDSAVRAAALRASQTMSVNSKVFELALEAIDDPAPEVQKELGALLQKISGMKSKSALVKKSAELAKHFATH